MEAKLGNWVKTTNHNHFGRVVGKHHDFKNTNEEDWWFDEQKPRLKAETREQSWYSILCHGGGSVLVPESDIKEAYNSKMKLDNNWASYYFDEE